jgi:anoctamin-10/anoctamin-7
MSGEGGVEPAEVNIELADTPRLQKQPTDIVGGVNPSQRFSAEGAPQGDHDFVKTNGYGYDIVMIFPVHEEEDVLSNEQQKWSMKKICERFAKVGLQLKLYYSVDREEIYVKIRAPLDLLKVEADVIDYCMELDPAELERRCATGVPEKNIDPIIFDEVPEMTTMSPYESIYGKYDQEEALQSIYKQSHGQLFSTTDRIKLITNLIRKPQYANGCGINARHLLSEKVILGYFPLHDEDVKDDLRAKWVVWKPSPIYAVWAQPLPEIREYFGEKVAMYFAWLGHYTKWLVVPSFLGIIVQANVLIEYTDYKATLSGPYGLFITLWCTFFSEAWKRNQIMYAMKWGTLGFTSDDEQERPEYKGTHIEHSPITGKPGVWFSNSERYRFVVQSMGAISGMVLAVVIVLCGIFGFRYWATQRSGDESVEAFGPIAASVANALQIQVLGTLYKTVAEKMNERENHRTDSEYENALIAKQFLFQFCNSYAALFYIAFVKEQIGDKCGAPDVDGEPPIPSDCTKELFVQLMIVFATRLVVGNTQEILVPKLVSWNKQRVEKKNAAALGGEEIDMSDAEEQFLLAPYGDDGLFEDYLEMVIQFGYSTLFVTAAPLAPLMSLLNNYVEIRIDGMKLTDNTQRPEPKGAENIGTWQAVLEVVGTMAVLTNVGIIIFTSSVETANEEEYEAAPSVAWGVFNFLVIEHSILLLKFGLELYIPDVPEFVRIQLERSHFLESKLIKYVPDDDEVDTTKLQRKKIEYNIADEGPANNSSDK